MQDHAYSQIQIRSVLSGATERFLVSSGNSDPTFPCPSINEMEQQVAGGWTRAGAVQDQIDDTVRDAVQFARARLAAGDGESHCQECGDEIPLARRRALAGARTCVPCQSARDSNAAFSAFNRRGSKDSQLR